MAPQARKGTALEEDRGADSRSILGRQPLQVQNQGGVGLIGVPPGDELAHIVIRSVLNCGHRYPGLHPVRFTGDDLVLQFLADGGEIGIVARHPNQQVFVILRIFLRLK